MARGANNPPATTPNLGAEVAAARPVLAEALARGTGWLTPSAAQQVLQSMGIPVVAAQAVANSPDAVSAAAQPWLPGGAEGRSARQSCTSPMSAP